MLFHAFNPVKKGKCKQTIKGFQHSLTNGKITQHASTN